MNLYNKEEWKAYEKANKEKRNARRRQLYREKKWISQGWYQLKIVDLDHPYIIITLENKGNKE